MNKNRDYRAFVWAFYELADLIWRDRKHWKMKRGLACCSEHNLVVVNKIRQQFIEALKSQGAAVLTPEEEKRFSSWAFEPKTHSLRTEIIGRSAATIADQYEIKRDYPIKLIVVPTEGVDSNNPYCYEKRAPVLSLFTVEEERWQV